MSASTTRDQNTQLHDALNSDLFKLVVPSLLSLIIFFGGSYVRDLKADMQDLKNAASEWKTINADKERRLVYLETLVPRRESQIAELNATLQTLRQDVAVLKAETDRRRYLNNGNSR